MQLRFTLNHQAAFWPFATRAADGGSARPNAMKAPSPVGRSLPTGVVVVLVVASVVVGAIQPLQGDGGDSLAN